MPLKRLVTVCHQTINHLNYPRLEDTFKSGFIALQFAYGLKLIDWISHLDKPLENLAFRNPFPNICKDERNNGPCGRGAVKLPFHSCSAERIPSCRNVALQ